MRNLQTCYTASAVRTALLGVMANHALEIWNAPRQPLEQDDVRELTDQQLASNLAAHERLIENIRGDADRENRELTEREDDRLFEAQQSLAVYQSESDRRATPRPRRSEPNGLQPGEDLQNSRMQNETRAQAAARQRQPRASVPAMPRGREHGMGGFNSSAEFLKAVMNGSARGGTVDPRLIANAPSTYGQEGVGADGGFAVPPDFRATIVQKVMGEESLLSRTDQLTSSSNSLTVPIDNGTPWQSSGGLQAYWESEAGVMTQSKPNLQQITTKLNKIICLVPLTDELLDDAPAMASYVNRRAPEIIDYKINEAIIKGTGVGQPLGILNSAGLITVAAESGQVADTVVYDNIVNMWATLPVGSRRRAVWLTNGDVDPQLMRMVVPGSNGIPAYMPPGGLSAAPYGTLLGRPVLSSEAMPALGDAGDLILADLGAYLTVLKSSGMRQDVSIHLYFDYDITAFRFVLRIAGQPWFNAPIVRPNGQSSRAFFAALGAR